MIEAYTKPEYIDIANEFLVSTNTTFWDTMSNLAYLDCLVKDWDKILNTYLSTEFDIRFKIEEDSAASVLYRDQEYEEVTELGNSVVLPADDRNKVDISSMKMMRDISFITYILPYKRIDFKPSPRLVTDLILMDAKTKGATDVHFETESMDDGSFRCVVKFRLGIKLIEQPQYKVDDLLLDAIISDMLSNRSSVAHKLSELAINPMVKFRLVDRRFPARCQIGKSIGGFTLVVRMFDFKQAPDIDTLGFDTDTQKMLHDTSRYSTGLTLVSGVFGSGKGTTLNAVGKAMEGYEDFAIASLDDPIEYLRRYSQYEYSNNEQLTNIINGFKKMDLNVVYLNEVITPEVADAVFNLVSSGVHVLTTIHTNRVYRIPYKLQELMGDKYLSLIQFINTLSYQDKFSVCCPDCTQGVSIDHYKDNADVTKLMKFLDLNTIKQSSGCHSCNNTGKLSSGIKVVNEFIPFNDEVKQGMLHLDVHEQVTYLKDYLSKTTNSLEEVIKKELINGHINIEEVTKKLDTWR